jgi:hypothetical protein
MEISRLLIEAISTVRSEQNQMPLPYSPGPPVFLGSAITMFLHKYEILAAFTITHPFRSDAVTMLPYHCVDGSNIPVTAVMMRG